MKRIALLPALLFATGISAQHYVRTKHNIGICASYSPFDNTVQQWSTHDIKNGSAFTAGICHEWNEIFYPEIFFVQHSSSFPLSNEEGTVNYKWNGVGAGILMKLDLFSIDNRKKNGYCFGGMINYDLGFDYVHALQLSPSENNFSKHDELAAKTGLGMYSVWGGSSKNHEAWTIYWEAYYRYGLTPFMKEGGEDFSHGSFNLGLRVMHYKTYKFSDM
ncbi:MAG: hypothetical protein HY064_12970 [Bacteroidetes bacterium]|nr:hypothetical protein [Bacteroidota bacterium]